MLRHWYTAEMREQKELRISGLNTEWKAEKNRANI